MTPAIAPATAFGFERLETFKTSTGECEECCDEVPTNGTVRRVRMRYLPASLSDLCICAAAMYDASPAIG
jgi:hypothetical protein